MKSKILGDNENIIIGRRRRINSIIQIEKNRYSCTHLKKAKIWLKGLRKEEQSIDIKV